MLNDSALHDHKVWLGYIQPDGLVVSPAALVDAQVLLDRNTLPLQERFLEFVQESDEVLDFIADFDNFAAKFLEWPEELLFGFNHNEALPESLKIPLPEFGEILEPSFALKDPRPKSVDNPWLLLVKILPRTVDLDAAKSEGVWNVSPSRRFERLLRETNVSIGLLSNGTHIKLIYAPKGENSGSLTFIVKDMTEIAGRPILSAFYMLLENYRLLAAPSEVRLPALLAKSREYQSRVSTTLAQQVLDSLYEMLRGFLAADEFTKGELLASVIKTNPDDVYAGLLTVLMRLVFLLFSEDRDLMPTSSLYVRHYSVHGLFERLRSDNEHYPDTMDHRFGAWPQLLTLFRAVYEGCKHPKMQMPARHGHLFDPAKYPFLEGKTMSQPRLPIVSDGTVFRVLEKLLILDGERLSYRTLDVEEIGSVYQTVMGFRLEVAAGPSIAIVGKRKHKNEVSAPTIINLNELLKSGERAKWLKEQTGQEFSGEAERLLKSATNIDDLLAALDRRIARNATPQLVPKGVAMLQPTDERRRSGSHYTPRSFTEPIVRTTLEPVLKRLGERPTPEQILELKICDLAVGSAAFLVEACRQLGDALVKSWHHYGNRPTLPADETEELLARRMVAQRCLYGVDRNPMAVDLAKLSLWLATLAKDHPFTFLDHSIRCGDSLVGLTRRQIADFHWVATKERVFGQERIEKRIDSATNYRRNILESDDFLTPELKREKLDSADYWLNPVREAGNLVVAAFFAADKDRNRVEKRDEFLTLLTQLEKDASLLPAVKESLGLLEKGSFPLLPFHWEIEFPEVFDRANSGFDAIVSNPPFAGKNTLINGNREGYLDWLKVLNKESHGNADLVAHFFRRAFDLLRQDGCLGLIATNTIGQGDTRATGLRWICNSGGTIYEARRRAKWPGQAAVIVSVVHIAKSAIPGPFYLDSRKVPTITAYLFHAGGHENPVTLKANEGKSFQGSIILGMGFTFDDATNNTSANSLAEMEHLISKNPRNAERIFPYIGGEEVNDSPTHAHHRYVINFADFPLRREDVGKSWSKMEDEEKTKCLRTGIVPLDYPEPVAGDWPDLLKVVEEKVKPERNKQNDKDAKQRWWLFIRSRIELAIAMKGKAQAIAISRVGQHGSFTFLPSEMVFSDSLVIFPLESFGAFCILQSRIHEVWARFFASSMKDDLRYTPSDCFETFPFPEYFELDKELELAGQNYYEFRAELMVRNNEGLTKTYNRFHDPTEQQNDIFKLRELHAAMDKAVLNAYGWNDLAEWANCDFLLDYEDDEDESENSNSRRRKKPWRYRWPDDIRDEVLARLLDLNAKRARQEQLAAATMPKQTSRTRPSKKKSPSDNPMPLFGE